MCSQDQLTDAPSQQPTAPDPEVASTPALSVVIPTYGAEASLEPLLDRLAATLEQRKLSWEAVVVNDASPDGTWAVLRRLAARRPQLVAVDLLRNHGQAHATLCGLAHARGALVATMDDDLQQPPEELNKLLDALDEHPDWDAAVGRWPRDDTPLRNLGSWTHAWVDRLTHGTPRGFRHTSLRLMRRPVVDALVGHQTRAPVLSPMLWRAATEVHNVDVHHQARPFGRSGFRIGRGLARIQANFFQGSTLPLRLLHRFGVVTATIAAILGVWYLVRWVLGAAAPLGWTTSILATMFFGGATLFGLGLLGEYLALALQEVRRAPRWSVRRVLGPSPPGSTTSSRASET